jgi:hypothetical protein
MKNNNLFWIIVPSFMLFLCGCETVEKGRVKKIKIDKDTEIKVETSVKHLPAEIKYVYIPEFINKVTGQIGIESRFRYVVKEEFLRDGRLSIVDDEKLADAKLEVEIDKYVLEPESYDENFVIESYRLRVLINVRLYEREKGEVEGVALWSEKPLWEEKALEGRHIYYIPTRPGGMTEAEAQEVVWRKLARDILLRTIEGFGTVSGTSQHKIPK